jgi:predicted ATP-grasp superfamily ATP-dependent carboligase
MRVFVYEYTCAVPCPHSSIRAEGLAMLRALVADFHSANVETVTLIGEYSLEREAEAFRKAAAGCDWSVVIAPEFDHLLEARCRWVEEAGGRLLGPAPDALRLTADKFLLSEHLARHGIPTPASRLVRGGEALGDCVFPVVYKPRHGAGSQATILIRHTADWPACVTQARAEFEHEEGLVQPCVRGQPASVAYLIGPRQRLALLPATQRLSADGRFRYEGGEVPLPDPLAERAVRLAGRAVECVPGLFGYVGVDLVLGEAADGRADWVIEINPRLTTSYLGLRQLAPRSLAGAMLQIAAGEEVALSWRPGGVRFGVEVDSRSGVECGGLATP